ncbi:MAG: AI-2E family transporter [Flavobacterium sp.]
MILSLTTIIKKLLILFLIFTGLYFAKDLLMPLCIGAILATLFLPLCKWMESKKMSRSIAIFFCLLTFLCVIFLLIAVLGLKISELLVDLAFIKQRAVATGSEIQKYIFNHSNISIDEQFEILKNEQPSYSNLLRTIFGSVAYCFTTFILVMAYFVFLLLYRNHIKKFLLKITPAAQKSEMKNILYSAAKISYQYLIGLSKMIGLLWIMYGIAFSIIGIENAVFFAVLCGLLEIIPYIGNITGTVLTVAFAAINGVHPLMLAGIVLSYGIIQLIQTWFFEPLIMGPQVKINPLFTIIALVTGELLWGIPGLVLAIPLTALLKIVCDHIPSLKSCGFLMGTIKPVVRS